MVNAPEDPPADVWSEWLLHRRHADDSGYGAIVQGEVERYADRVLDHAKLAPEMTLVDVGAGEGLLAFRAIARIGSRMRVILTDISVPMLRHAQASAARRGVQNQCTFLECPADDLREIPSSAVDVVMTRASIAYVSDKKTALREFYRVLKPGGRISIGEPIFQDEAFAARALRHRMQSSSGRPPDRFLTLLHRWKSAQFPDTEEGCAKNPLVNYSERDLVNLCRSAGFSEVHMQLHIDVAPSLITSWDIFLGSSPHPWAPPLRRILAEQFSADERQLFEQIVRPEVESGRNFAIDRIAYLNALKPALDTSIG